jgi:glutamate racemase
VQKEIEQSVTSLYGRNTVRIAVLDSGLGGLSICADLESSLQECALFKQATLLYFNVWPEQNRGYNSLESVAERISVFDRALEGVSNFQPDLIMIACNTLSVIYDRTPFSRHTTIPVLDIVDFGVDLIYSALRDYPDSQALILGTRTTVSEKVHQQKLMQKGVDRHRIKAQACHGVATEIEKDPKGAAVETLIDAYMEEAAPKLIHRKTILVALCCTHFAYSSDIFKNKLLDRLSAEIVILNPNAEMSGSLFIDTPLGTFPRAEISIKVISKIVLVQSKIHSMSNAVRMTSNRTANALVNYEYQPDLF